MDDGKSVVNLQEPTKIKGERFQDCYLFNRQDESNLFLLFSQKNLTKTSVAENRL